MRGHILHSDANFKCSSVTPNFLSSNQTFFTLPPIKSHELDYKIFISPIFVKETNVRWKIMYDSFFFDLDTRRIIILDSKTIVPSSVLENSRGSISYSLSLEDLSSSPVFLGNKFDRRDPPGRFVPVSARYHEEEEGWWRA